MISLKGFANIGRTFAHRNFRFYQAGRLANLIGNWMFRVGLGWLTWEMTESSAWLGIVGFADMAPAILVSPVAGVLADRMDRLKIIWIFQSMALTATFSLSLLVFFEIANIWIVVGLAFLHGAATAVAQPASHSLVPMIVPPGELPTALAVNALSFNLSRFVGPILAGPIIVLWGTGPAIGANALGTAAMLLLLIGIRVPPTAAKSHRHRRMIPDIVEGLRYTAGHAGIRPLMVIVAAYSILAFPLTHLMPGFAADVYGTGANGLAWLTAFQGTGAMLQGAYLAQRGHVRGLTKWIVFNLFLGGAGFLALMTTANFWIGLGLMFFIGFTLVANRVGSQTLFQYAVAGNMRGRVSSLYIMIFNAGPAIGSLLIGFIAERFGLQATFAGAGILILGFWLWSLTRQKTIAAAVELEAPLMDGEDGKAA